MPEIRRRIGPPLIDIPLHHRFKTGRVSLRGSSRFATRLAFSIIFEDETGMYEW
jgi:hypothetical protein